MAAAVAPINFETEIAYLKDPERVVSDEVVGDASLREPHKKIVYDMRPARDEFELDIHGFQILDIPLKERNDKDISEVTTKYFKEVEELLKDKLGAKHVYCFAPVLRPLDLADKPIPNTQKTIPRPHLDFGPASAAEWWKWFTDPGLQQGVPAWLESIGVDWNQPPRYSILGLWRPLYKAVERDPLCVSDWKTVPDEDYVILQPNKRKTYDGEWSVMKHGQKEGIDHKWWYLSAHRPDELLVFKHHDSHMDQGVAWRCGHGAFPMSGTDHLPDRESLEIRAFCIY
ncbi:uncharacterized protein PG998_009222 [Apiospora kogelbergensis]|uniref:uncharacterized protein n=1 Tax=Apiospora kogelbergensis TaxID=1337665 RepID=UPI0031322934